MIRPKSPILKRARAIVKTTVQEPVLPSDFFFIPAKKGYSFENMTEVPGIVLKNWKNMVFLNPLEVFSFNLQFFNVNAFNFIIPFHQTIEPQVLTIFWIQKMQFLEYKRPTLSR